MQGICEGEQLGGDIPPRQHEVPLNLKLLSTLFVSAAKSVRKGATHHLVSTKFRLSFFCYAKKFNATLCFLSPKKLRFLGTPKKGAVPLPILLRKTGMISFAMHQRRKEVRGRPTTPQFDFNRRLKLHSNSK